MAKQSRKAGKRETEASSSGRGTREKKGERNTERSSEDGQIIDVTEERLGTSYGFVGMVPASRKRPPRKTD